jgi:hypothetical protein
MCIFNRIVYAYSKYTGFDKATLDTRGGGGNFHRGRLLITDYCPDHIMSLGEVTGGKHHHSNEEIT